MESSLSADEVQEICVGLTNPRVDTIVVRLKERSSAIKRLLITEELRTVVEGVWGRAAASSPGS